MLVKVRKDGWRRRRSSFEHAVTMRELPSPFPGVQHAHFSQMNRAAAWEIDACSKPVRQAESVCEKTEMRPNNGDQPRNIERLVNRNPARAAPAPSSSSAACEDGPRLRGREGARKKPQACH